MEKRADTLLGQADPHEAFEQRMEEIRKLSEAGKISAEERSLLEQKATEEFDLNMRKRVKSQEKAATAMMTPLQKLAHEWGDLAKRAGEAAVSIANAFSNNISTGLFDMISGAKSVKQAFSDMALGIVNDISKIIIKLLVEYAISKAIKGLGGGVAGGGGIIGTVLGGIFHEGGTVGGPAPARVMNAGSMSGARKYHSGGVAGLGAGEVPAVLERGEQVLTRRQATNIKKRLTGKDTAAPAPRANVTNINLIDAAQVPAMMAQYPDALLNVINLNQSRVRRILA
jgi:lambda family phage tail tape measure protein